MCDLDRFVKCQSQLYCKSSVIKHGTTELQWLQCFKMVFFEIPNVLKGMVLTEKVTYCFSYINIMDL